VIFTINEYISALKALKAEHKGTTSLLAFDRLLTDDQAADLGNHKFEQVHDAIDEALDDVESAGTIVADSLGGIDAKGGGKATAPRPRKYKKKKTNKKGRKK
jgi:hypothetical protein